jgi:COMPASS component SPP1
LKLARNRLEYFLKEESNELNNENRETVADELNKKQLKTIDEEINSIKLKLNEIDKEHLKLDLIIEQAKGKKINEKYEIDKEQTEETEVYCVTCGHICSHSNALKHMEKCYNKVIYLLSIFIFFKSILVAGK